jgi:hypothetical protein
MEWPTVMETLAVSAHRRVALVPWQVAPPATEGPREADPAPRPPVEAGLDVGTQRDAW